MKRLVVGALTALLLGACSSSSSGGAKQPEDEFLDKVESACRDAGKTVHKLDAGDASAPSDLRDVISDMADSLNALTAPASLEKDFDDYTTNIDDQVAALGKITSAAEGDSAAEQDAVSQLNTLRSANDKTVNALEIFSCLGLVPINGLTPPADVTVSTTEPTTATTEVATTEAPSTTQFVIPTTSEPPPETTTAPTDNPTVTSLPPDLSLDEVAPPGYTWVPFNPPDISDLYGIPNLRDVITYYAGGDLKSDADSSTATVYVIRLAQDFDDAATKAYQYWENTDKGTDVTTPGGLTVHQQLRSFENTDCNVYISGSRGVTICTYKDYDGLTLMDQYIAANPT